MAQTGKSIDGVEFKGNTVSVTNKKKVAAETVTLKVKKTWDGKEKAGHPVTKFGLFKAGKLVPDTVQTLNADQHELTWTGIKKSELESYYVYELNEKNEKPIKYIVLGDTTYEVIPPANKWVEDSPNVYSRIFDNVRMSVITIEKEWKDKSGGELKDDSLKSMIFLEASDDKGHNVRENHDFTTTVTSNDYYIAAALNKYSFKEGNVALQLDQQVEVAIDGRTFLATLSQVKENHYKVVNQEKPDAPKEHKVKVSKRALAVDGVELAGASLQVFARVAGEQVGDPVHEWVSGKVPHEFVLTAGEYRLVESAAPQGYEVATAIDFTVGVDGSVSVGETRLDSDAPIVMVDALADYPVKVSKRALAVDGVELAGASLQVFARVAGEQVGDPVHEWVSGKVPHEFVLTAGEYRLVESAAPQGYEVATAIDFTVGVDGSVSVGETRLDSDAPIVMVDALAEAPTPDIEPETNQDHSAGSELSQTGSGNATALILYALLIVLSGSALIALGLKRRK
ncbi:SpaA isopeptide-forming pilin-related protein [Arcanobacterium hippocoleae]